MTEEKLSRRSLLMRVFTTRHDPTQGNPPNAPAQVRAPDSQRRARQPRMTAYEPPLLRPPGALAEADFAERCTRCGECAKACPTGAIRSAPPQFGSRSGTPWIDPYQAACQLCEDLPCIAACAAGALDLSRAGAMGTAQVRAIDCLNRMGSPCSSCVEHCPVPGAIVLDGSLPHVAEALCVGCGTCAYVCPAPMKAILIVPRRDTSRKVEPHRDRAPALELETPIWRRKA